MGGKEKHGKFYRANKSDRIYRTDRTNRTDRPKIRPVDNLGERG